MDTLSETLRDYISIYKINGIKGGAVNTALMANINAGTFKPVYDHYFEDALGKKLLELKLKDDKKDEFKNNQVELVTEMLKHVNQPAAITSGEPTLGQLTGGTHNKYWEILGIAAALTGGAPGAAPGAPVVPGAAPGAAPGAPVVPGAAPGAAPGAPVVPRAAPGAAPGVPVVPVAKPTSFTNLSSMWITTNTMNNVDVSDIRAYVNDPALNIADFTGIPGSKGVKKVRISMLFAHLKIMQATKGPSGSRELSAAEVAKLSMKLSQLKIIQNSL